VENFAVGGDVRAIGVDESLIESGVVDSTGLLELVYFLESRYALTFPTTICCRRISKPLRTSAPM
jgi:acyl carrier protein